MSAAATADTPRPLRRDAAENRRRLLDAAQTIFNKHGLDASVDSIAEAAGVGLGTFYRRFPTKDALITEIVTDMNERLLAVAEAACDRGDGEGLAEYLRAVGAQLSQRRGCLPVLWEQHRAEDIRIELRKRMVQLVDDAKAHGKLNSAVTPADIMILMWSLRGVIETTGDAAPEASTRHLDVALAGLASAGLTYTTPAITMPKLAARNGRS